MNDEHATYYETWFLETCDRLIRVLGSPTVNRLLDRAVTEIGAAHPSVSAIHLDDDKIDVTGLRRALADASPEQVRDTFTALNGVLLLLVARLLGREVAQRLTEGLSVSEYLRIGGKL